MIVRGIDDTVLLITQPDHAHLARRIMERCVPLSQRPRRDSILHAVGEHDNGWTEADAAPDLDPESGTVIDFVHAPLRVRHEVWPRGVARLADDPWAAALVAQHALTVYERYRSHAEWTPFFSAMEAARDTMLHASGRRSGELAADYAFVRLGDLISLMFCTGMTDLQQFADWSVQLSGARVIVTPDAFGGERVPIEITGRAIRRAPLRSTAELRRAVAEGSAMTLRGEVAASRA
jgi:hypothetical protein